MWRGKERGKRGNKLEGKKGREGGKGKLAKIPAGAHDCRLLLPSGHYHVATLDSRSVTSPAVGHWCTLSQRRYRT